jgi:hypothetical protein
LMMRLKRYAEEEKAALDRWSENCRMMQKISPVAKGGDASDGGFPLPDPFEDVLGG